MLGRNFRAGEDTPTGAKVLILSYSTWRDRYGSSPGVIGKVVRMNGQPFTIIGVMPEGFAFPNNDKVWVPLQTDPLASKRGEGQFVQAFGRLKPNVTIDEASVELGTIGKRLADAYPESNAGFIGTTAKFTDDYIGKEPRQLLYAMMGAVFLVRRDAVGNRRRIRRDRDVQSRAARHRRSLLHRHQAAPAGPVVHDCGRDRSSTAFHHFPVFSRRR